MSLQVSWDGRTVGLLERVSETTREYAFRYTDRTRALSLSLPTSEERFSPARSRPFFEALLPEGAVREQIASQLRLAVSDSYGLLAALGRDCAGAIQIYESERRSDPPGVAWLTPEALDQLIRNLPTRPLGVRAGDERLRLSLAGVQRKAVLVRDASGRFGEPLNGQPSTHIVKPDPADEDHPGLARNEHFCMLLARACGLRVADTELLNLAQRPCLVVRRFDRDLLTTPVRRIHQEDLCQALGITPEFKYQHEGWRVPSFAALAEVLDRHGAQPGVDRLGVADGAVFNVLIGNADAHAKNISLLHADDGRVRLAPLYDLVSTSVYPQLNAQLALAIGGEYDVDRLSAVAWMDFASDLGLRPHAFLSRARNLTLRVRDAAHATRREAAEAGHDDPILEEIVALIEGRAEQLLTEVRA